MSAGGDGSFAYSGLDRVLHEKARLSVLTALLSSPRGLPFVELKRLCDLTDGNLARHLEVLDREGLCRSRKQGADGRPQTLVALTPKGRRAFLAYLEELERVLRDAREAGGTAGSPATA
ncbi:MAG: transcriptional regulator [Planctomycetota bacterium]